MTPKAEDYLGYPGMSLGLLGIRDLKDLGFESLGVGLLGISQDVLGTTWDQELRGSVIGPPSCRTAWDIP